MSTQFKHNPIPHLNKMSSDCQHYFITASARWRARIYHFALVTLCRVLVVLCSTMIELMAKEIRIKLLC